MSQTASTSDQQSGPAGEMTARLLECDALVASRSNSVRQLEESLGQERAELARATEMRDSIRSALESLQAAQAQVEEQIEAYDAFARPPRLRVVEDDASEQDSFEPGHYISDALPHDAPTIIIRGDRALSIMRVISTEPEREWSVKAVTTELGATDAAGDKRIRAGLEELYRKGALSKKTARDGWPVTFRQIANWRPAFVNGP